MEKYCWSYWGKKKVTKKYKKGDKMFEAILWNGIFEVDEFLHSWIGKELDWQEAPDFLLIPGIKGVVAPGDYIIKNEKGKFSKCKRSIFEKTYEEIK